MALITDMGVEPVAGGILHPQVKNKWKVNFHGIGGPRGGGNSDPNILTLQAISGDRPKLEFEKITLDRYNSRAWIAGKHSWQPANFTFESDIGTRVVRIFQEQLEKQQAIIGVNSGQVLNSAASADQYKFAMTVDMLDGDVTSLERWAYEGAWIENIDYGDLDYSASESMKITVTFSFDHARQLNTGIDGKATHGQAPM